MSTGFLKSQFHRNGDEENGRSRERNETYQNGKEANSKLRNADGALKLKNPNIEFMSEDSLYHIALGSGTHDLEAMFGDIKFVCMGGTSKRMKDFADFIMKEIGYELPVGSQLQDISADSHRFSMYKVGPVLSINHGIGMASLGVLLHEVIKLMYYAKCKDPVFIRIGTSGGVGVEGGTVVVSDSAVDDKMRDKFEMTVLGKTVHRPILLDKDLANEIRSLADPQTDGYNTVCGKTMGTHDFYEGQGRIDGAFCDYSKADKLEFLEKLHGIGVVNIEMEASMFGALTHYAGIKAAIVCVALLNRLNGDQISTMKNVIMEWQKRPQILVSRFIKKRISQEKLNNFK